MAKRDDILAGAADQTIDVFIQDSSSTAGAGLSGLAYNTSGLKCYYRKGATGSATALTLATQTVGGAHSDGGFVEIDATNMKGVYRLDLSDTIVAAAGMVTLYLYGATNMAPVAAEILVQPATGKKVDVVSWNTAAVSVPTNAGVPNVNAKTWNDLATVALPLVPTTAGRTLDVSAGGEAGVDWANVGSPTTTLDLSGTTIKTTQQVDVNTIKTQTVTCAAGVTVLASVGTAATSTAQTGDNYARIGAPVGASISADIAAVKAAVDTVDDFLDTEIAAILDDTANTLDDYVDDLEGRLTAALATWLQAHALAGGRGVVDASSTTTAVVFKSVNGAAASATNDFYNGRSIVFTSGALALQATSISDYTGASKTATVPALTGAPAEDVTFVIV